MSAADAADAADACADHCPFLNRRDSRCGQHMSLAGLDHAFEYCFGRYQGCPVYFQMLIERRARRGEVVTMPQPTRLHATVQLTIHRDAIDPRDRIKTTRSPERAAAHANAA